MEHIKIISLKIITLLIIDALSNNSLKQFRKIDDNNHYAYMLSKWKG